MAEGVLKGKGKSGGLGSAHSHSSSARPGGAGEQLAEVSQRGTFDKDMQSLQELDLEKQRAESKLRDSMVAYIGLSQELSSRVKSMEASEKQRREVEDGFAQAKPLVSTTLEERRQAAEISHLKLTAKLANDKACRLQVEISALKDELKALENMSSPPTTDTERDVDQDELKRLRRQVKTKETLCTTVINELEAVRKELAEATNKRDQFSMELEAVMKGAEAQAESAKAIHNSLQARLQQNEEEKRKLLSEVLGASGAQLVTDGKSLTRKELLTINRQWEGAYNSLKQEYHKLKVRTADSEGNPKSRRKKRTHSKKLTSKHDPPADDTANPLGKEPSETVPVVPPPSVYAINSGPVVQDPAVRSSAVGVNATTPAVSSGVTQFSVMLSHHLPPAASSTAVAMSRAAAVPPSLYAAAPLPTDLLLAETTEVTGSSSKSSGAADNTSNVASGNAPPGSSGPRPTDGQTVSLLHRELEDTKVQASELRLHIARLQEALFEKRTQLAEEKEHHELTMAEKESLLMALAASSEKPQVDEPRQLDETQRLTRELQTSVKAEQRLRRELDAMKATNRQDNVRLADVHKELLRLTNEKRKLEADLSEATSRLSAIETQLVQRRT
ncbi:uncharacterized protein LOC135815903 [Sycon ciliatum]|uniref:uncharacterized protein LOC135815903 n=1 Tax=Sycon ciliatum TaxID=27933 RepID=UPI0031F62CC1